MNNTVNPQPNSMLSMELKDILLIAVFLVIIGTISNVAAIMLAQKFSL